MAAARAKGHEEDKHAGMRKTIRKEKRKLGSKAQASKEIVLKASP